MLGPLFLPLLSALGQHAPSECLPRFFPYSHVAPPPVERICLPFQWYPDYERLLEEFRAYRKKKARPTLQPDEGQENHLAMSSSSLVALTDRTVSDSAWESLRRIYYKTVLAILPEEQYRFVVPKVRFFSHYLWPPVRRGIRYIYATFEDALAEGPFLSPLENGDDFSAGHRAHEKSQYFWEALVMTRDLYQFVMSNTEYAELRSPVLAQVSYLKGMHERWNQRRLHQYHLKYTISEGAQMMLALKHHARTASTYTEQLRITSRMQEYEWLSTGATAAFFNECMRQKGLSWPEKVVDVATHAFSRLSSLLNQPGNVQEPPPLTKCLALLEEMLEKDRERELRPLPKGDVADWKPHDWELDPASPFERELVEGGTEDGKKSVLSPNDHLCGLLIADQITTALHFCQWFIESSGNDATWVGRKALVEKYQTMLDRLFGYHKDVDTVSQQLALFAHGAFEKEGGSGDLSRMERIYNTMFHCRQMSRDIYNAMVALKTSLVHEVEAEVRSGESMFEWVVNEAQRDFIRYATQGHLFSQIPLLDDVIARAERLVAPAEELIRRGRLEVGFDDQTFVTYPQPPAGAWLYIIDEYVGTPDDQRMAIEQQLRQQILPTRAPTPKDLGTTVINRATQVVELGHLATQKGFSALSHLTTPLSNGGEVVKEGVKEEGSSPSVVAVGSEEEEPLLGGRLNPLAVDWSGTARSLWEAVPWSTTPDSEIEVGDKDGGGAASTPPRSRTPSGERDSDE